MKIDKLSVAVEIDVTAYSDMVELIDIIIGLSRGGDSGVFAEKCLKLRDRLEGKIADVEKRASE